MTHTYKIDFLWDNEAHVWIATSKDVQGLVLEHDSFDILVDKVRLAVPELLELQGVLHKNINLALDAHKTERLVISG